jgi:hypothetical protein
VNSSATSSCCREECREQPADNTLTLALAQTDFARNGVPPSTESAGRPTLRDKSRGREKHGEQLLAPSWPCALRWGDSLGAFHRSRAAPRNVRQRETTWGNTPWRRKQDDRQLGGLRARFR